MPSGWKSGGVEIDTLFMARVNTKRADVNLDYNNSDMSNEFEPIGDGTPRANVNIKSNNIDIAQLFRDITDSLESLIFPSTHLTIATTGLGSPDLTGHRFNTDGTCNQTSINGSWVGSDDWLNTVPGDASDYEIRWNETSGTTADNTYGTENAWLPLSSQRTMSFNAGGVGSAIMNYTLEIREVGNDSTKITRTMQLDQGFEPS